MVRDMTKSILDSPMHTTRLLLALSSYTWVLILFTACNLFEGGATYSIMAVIANEHTWGFLFFVHGTLALYTLGTGTRNKWTLMLDGLLGCVLWTASTTACFAAHWPNAETWLISFKAYKPPAAMSADIWMSVAAWVHFIKHWAIEEGRGDGQ